MRRDVTHYYEKSVAEVYTAYKAAAEQQFGRDCRDEPYHTLTFGLNYSIKYNMSGGACTIHFMPYGTGTAVDLRYSIVQLAGARYGAHDADLSKFVTAYLGVPVQKLDIDPETFLLEQNKVKATAAYQPPVYQQPVQQPVYQQPIQPQARPLFCGKCGSRLNAGAAFCGNCGNKIN